MQCLSHLANIISDHIIVFPFEIIIRLTLQLASYGGAGHAVVAVDVGHACAERHVAGRKKQTEENTGKKNKKRAKHIAALIYGK